MADKPAPLPSTAFRSPNPAAHARPLPLSSSSSYFHHRRPVPTAAPMASNHQPQASMAPPPLPAPSMDAKKVDISTLMSPPDPVIDSFGHGAPAMDSRAAAKADGARQPLPMSPPVSPYSKALPATAATSPPGQQVRDPVLYPADDRPSPASPPQLPLFAPTDSDHGRIVDQHVRARPPGIFAAGVSPPCREDYELVLAFRSQVMKHYTTNRKGWLRQERALLEADRRAGAQRYHAIMPGPAKPVAAKAAGRSQPRADRVAKPLQGGPRPNRNVAAAAPPAARAARTSRPAPGGGRVSATPEPSRRASQPSREDKDFNALPNYCPPLASLPNRPNSLKVDWKGQPIDLSNDANAHLMHPDELALAASLRLDCATYLTSKRRMFERRLQCLRTGKEFRKTDAQQACKIDVNKASKLWTAFDKVGWLDPSWVRQFL